MVTMTNKDSFDMACIRKDQDGFAAGQDDMRGIALLSAILLLIKQPSSKSTDGDPSIE